MKVVFCLAVLIGCAACAPFDMPNIQLPQIQLPNFGNPIIGALMKFVGGRSVNAWDKFAANLGLPKHDDPKLAALSNLGGSAVNSVVAFAQSEKKANSIANHGRLQALVDLGYAFNSLNQGNVSGAVNEVGDAVGKVVQSLVSSKTTMLAERIKAVAGLAVAALNAIGQARANQGKGDKVLAASESLEKLADNLANALENDLTEAVNGALVKAGNAVRDAALNKLKLKAEGKITKEEEIALINEINQAAEIAAVAEQAQAETTETIENTETETIENTETETIENTESTKYYAGPYETAAAA